uniref:amidohydrolase family protein n=1 Tax=Altererythrobacter segetis TaxID=1104773 RepID=UPI001407705F|nr:amidohydrolase family protein [Altererythrobacter segetis]
MPDRRILLAADNLAVGIEGGALVEPAGAFDLELRFPGCAIRPGLINAHDHLHRNHYGRLGTPPYPSAYAWGSDVERRYRDRIAAGRRIPRREALLAGAWKNLFAGVTTVVHHDPWEADFEREFPLRVAPVPSADSLGMTPELERGEPGGLLALHVAEGVDPVAAGEVRELEARGLLDANLLAIHCVGVDADAAARFRRSGAAFCWCPSSNLFLFGQTAPPAMFAEDIDLLLGSDSHLTSDGDLLDELRLARATGLARDRRLEQAIGETAARRLGLPVARLAPGEPADVVVLAAPLLEASAADVVLVLAGGTPRVARPDLAPMLEQLGYCGRLATVRGIERWTSGAAI